MSSDILQELLIEFLEVWLHNVVYICNIYPSQIFRSRYKYSVSVKQSTFPPLNNYIRNLLLSLQKQLSQHALHSLTLDVHRGLQLEESFSLLLSYPLNTILSPEECVAKCKDAFRGHVACVLNSQSESPREAVDGRTFSVRLKTSELVGCQMVEWCSETIQELGEGSLVTPLLFSDVGAIRVQSIHRN